MRNLTETSVVIQHPGGGQTLVKRWKETLDLPELYDEQDAVLQLGHDERPVRVRRRRPSTADERERLNADLRRHVNDDRDETGDGIVLVKRDVLPLVNRDLRQSVFTPEPAVSTLRASPLIRWLIGAGDGP